MPEITLPKSSKSSKKDDRNTQAQVDNSKQPIISAPTNSDQQNSIQPAFVQSQPAQQQSVQPQPAQQLQPIQQNSDKPQNNGLGGGFNQGWNDPFGGSSWGDSGGDAFGGWGGDPWSDPWGGTNGNNPQQKEKRLTPQERVKMIEEVYESVLNRKPDTRDINYYKYSTLDEAEIRRQLLDGKEHKQLIEDGREFKKVKARAEQSETRVKMLEGQIKDQVEEFKQLTQLLNEKNRYIQSLRMQIGSSFKSDNAHYYQQRSSENASYQIPFSQPVSDVSNQITETFGDIAQPIAQQEVIETPSSFAQVAEAQREASYDNEMQNPPVEEEYREELVSPDPYNQIVETLDSQEELQPVNHVGNQFNGQQTFSSPSPKPVKTSSPTNRLNPTDQIVDKIKSIFSI